MKQLSRREFVMVAGLSTIAPKGAKVGAAAAPFGRQQQPRRGATAISAQDIIDRIRKNVGVDWKTDSVDTFKAGDPASVVTGVVTTAMATMNVLSQAVKAGANLVITCEPTFYGRADSPTPPPARGATSPAPPDPVFTAKRDFIDKHQLVVWRFSDHWRLRRPDPFAAGIVDAMGWSKFTSGDEPARVSIPAVTLDALASALKRNLNARGGIRVVGDPSTKVQRIALLPGTTPIQASLRALPGVDAIVAGEVREWESIEYARDAVTAGQQKGFIVLGRALSEEPGMNVCAQWLRTLVPEIRTTWIRVGDPYWRPV
jgi:putative NIF3 family GTP cyclohydrolase 1 type 2